MTGTWGPGSGGGELSRWRPGRQRSIRAAGVVALSVVTGIGSVTGCSADSTPPATPSGSGAIVGPAVTTGPADAEPGRVVAVPVDVALQGLRASRAARAAPSRGGVTLPALRPGPYDGRTVVLDAGHNGVYRAEIATRQVNAGNGRTKDCNTSGTSGISGLSEHAHNWDVVARTAGLLRVRGARVVLTRPDDAGIGPCVDERAAIGNRARADLVLSVHADGNDAASARGYHVIVAAAMAGGPQVQAQSRDLAERVRDAFGAGTGLPRSTYAGSSAPAASSGAAGAGRGSGRSDPSGISVRRDIAGLTLSRVPAVMLEAGNMRHPRDGRLLADPEFRQKEADALLVAVDPLLRR